MGLIASAGEPKKSLGAPAHYKPYKQRRRGRVSIDIIHEHQLARWIALEAITFFFSCSSSSLASRST